MYIIRIIIAVIFFTYCPFVSRAQVTSADLQDILSSTDKMYGYGITAAKKVQQFYSFNGFKPVWLTYEGREVYNELSELIRNARYLALDPCDYSSGLSGEEDKCIVLTETIDSVILELKITDAAIRFFSDIANGNNDPSFSYDGLSYTPPDDFIPLRLFGSLHAKGLRKLADALNNSMPQVRSILAEIYIYLAAMKKPGFSEEIITSAKVAVSNPALCKKLYYLGCTDSLVTGGVDSVIVKALKKAQEKFDLLNDGVLRKTSIAELNIPLSERLSRLYRSVNYYRWLAMLTQWQPVIVVNIPAAYLKVYEKGEIKLEMRLIVGKPSTPTPTLTSRVTEVILYPYWIVPSSIIKNELLPTLRRNPGYINANNYQVLNKNGKVLDPGKINWKQVSASAFPYIIRQSTGCDNALGMIKLNFFNPYTVYLHDTPNKLLFMTKRRYYSHGCMRMEKPLELGHFILGDNRIAIDTLEEKGCLKNQSPIIVPAANKLPVIVWYNPADINAEGRIIFYEDIYKKFNN